MAATKSTSAIVHREVGQPARLETLTLTPLQPREALIEVHATGICHTDLSCLNGTIPVPVPCVLGHEGAGVVLDVGSDVSHVSPGDKVILSISYCGECNSCTSGHPAYCTSFVPLNLGCTRADGTAVLKDESDGKVHGHYFGQSCFGRHAIVSASSTIKVAADTDLELYAPLGCGLQTGVGAVLNSLKVTKGSSLAIWGVGPVGLAAVMGGVLAGAKTIVAIDLQQDRLELAREMGATAILDGNDADVVAQVMKLSGTNGMNFAADCSGVPSAIENMINCLGAMGRGCSIGAPSPGTKVGVDVFSHLLLGREYIGCTEGDAVPSKMIPYLIEQHKAGRLPFDKMIHRYSADEFQNAFDDMSAFKVIKPVLIWK